MEQVDILSFDGGGSRGIMEVAILQDVMRLATILWQDPTSLKYLTEDKDNDPIIKDTETAETVFSELGNVIDPIHPTDVYDMIVGTSTGGLIAFGLVGGKRSDDGKRLPMTLDECILLYLEETRKIFHKSLGCRLLSFIPGVGKLFTYPQRNLQEVLEKQFEGSRLTDFEGSKCVAGAVARRIGEKEELVLFDTRNDIYSGYTAEQVLLATSNAPVFFKTPVRIGSNEFVDGGVGGNCPLVQAIPRGKEIFGAKVRSALSIAPPPREKASIPKRLQISYWLNYFVHQLTDGQAVYREAKSRHKSVKLRRLAPRGERLKKFELDEGDAEGMLNEMNKEKMNNHLFLADIIATATAVVDTYLAKNKTSAEETADVAAQLSYMIGKVYAKESEYEKAEDTYNTALDLLKKSTNKKAEIAVAEIYDEIGQTMVEQAKYRQATDLYQESVKRWRAIYGEVDHPTIANALYKLGTSSQQSGFYEEAHASYSLALQMKRKVYEGDTAGAEISTTLNQIGRCYSAQEKYQQAIEFFYEALGIQKKLYHGKDHLYLAKTLNSFGECLVYLKNYSRGEKYIKKSLNMRTRLLQQDKNHPAIARALNNLGWCLMMRQQFKGAEEKIQTALQMMKRHYANKDHPAIAKVLVNLARLKLYQGKYNTSVEYAQQSIAMNKKCFGDVDNLMISKALNIIGRCFCEEGKFTEANKKLTDAVEMMKRIFGRGIYPSLADALVDLGECHSREEKYTEARADLEKALEIKREVNGEITSVLQFLSNISEKLGETGNVGSNSEEDEVQRLLH